MQLPRSLILAHAARNDYESGLFAGAANMAVSAQERRNLAA